MSGSVEALEDALLKIDVGEDVVLRVIGRGVGAITQDDVNLAIASEAVIIGFNVRRQRVGELAQREGVDIRYYSVIYQAIEEIEAALKGMLKPEFEEVQLGTAEIREIFRVPRIGNVAGCIVRSGTITRHSKARLIRDGVVVSDSLTVDSLRGSRTTSTEVREGFECGIGVGYGDIKVEDVIETFEMREKPGPDPRRRLGPGTGRPTGAPGLGPGDWARRLAETGAPETGPGTGRRLGLIPRRSLAPGWRMYVGALTLDVLLGDVRSLKQKRSAVRPLVAELSARTRGRGSRDRLSGAAPAGRDRRGRVSPRPPRTARRPGGVRAFVAGRPEIELLSARQRLFNEEE